MILSSGLVSVMSTLEVGFEVILLGFWFSVKPESLDVPKTLKVSYCCLGVAASVKLRGVCAHITTQLNAFL